MTYLARLGLEWFRRGSKVQVQIQTTPHQSTGCFILQAFETWATHRAMQNPQSRIQVSSELRVIQPQLNSRFLGGDFFVFTWRASSRSTPGVSIPTASNIGVGRKYGTTLPNLSPGPIAACLKTGKCPQNWSWVLRSPPGYAPNCFQPGEMGRSIRLQHLCCLGPPPARVGESWARKIFSPALFEDMAVVRKQWDPILGFSVNSPPILELILVGIGMFTGG